MSNIPSFSDVCGTVVESLAETIQNREKIIVQLREENARLERVAADAVRKATVWKNEVEACEGDEKKIRDLQEEVQNLRKEIEVLNNTIDSRRDWSIKNQRILADRYLLEISQLHTEIRRLNGNQMFIAPMWRKDGCTQAEVRSDSDPQTGVQYGDLT